MYLTDPITIPPLPPLQVEVILLVYLTSLAATSFVQPPIGGLNYNLCKSFDKYHVISVILALDLPTILDCVLYMRCSCCSSSCSQMEAQR